MSLPRIYDKIFSLPTTHGKLSLTLESQSGHDVVLDFDYNRRNNPNAQVLKSKSNSMMIIGVTFLIGHAIGFEDHGNFRVLIRLFVKKNEHDKLVPFFFYTRIVVL